MKPNPANRAGKKKVKNEEPEEPETPPPEVIIDPYEHLRYQQPHLHPVGFRRSALKTTVVPVLKSKVNGVQKRKLNPKREDDGLLAMGKGLWDKNQTGKGDDYDYLRTEVSDPEPLTKWNHIRKSVEGHSRQAICQPGEFGKLYQRALNISLGKETAALENFKKMKLQQLTMENHCIERTKKNRQDLLLRRGQFLPHLHSTKTEISQIKQVKYVTPRLHPMESAFIGTMDTFRNRREIIRQQSQRQPTFDITTEWVGCPEVTDEIRRKLYKNADRKMPLVGKDTALMIEVDARTETPSIPTLGVLGLKYDKAQRRIKESTRRQRRRLSKRFRTAYTAADGKTASEISASEMMVEDKESDQIENAPRVRLSIGNVKLSWKTNPDCAREEKIIELGCTADIGKSAVNWISMKNTGSAAIYFHWVKRGRKDLAEFTRVDERPVIFDTTDGVILPSEEFRLPVMYKAISSGYYSEDWYLVTKPVLENGAPVILRLWGLSREYDPYILARSRIKEMMKSRMIQSICRLRVQKIVNFLPLRERAQREVRFPTVYDAPEVFVYKNPWLSYHSAYVYGLGKLHGLIEAQCKLPERVVSEEQGESANIKSKVTPVGSGSMVYKDTGGKEDTMQRGSVSQAVSLKSASLDPMIYYQTLDRICLETNIDHLKLERSLSQNIISPKKSASSSKDNLSEGSDTSTGETGDVEDDVQEDQPHLDDPLTSPAPNSKKTLTNVVDPNVDVHSIRSELLRCQGNPPFQEAAFHVMATCIDRLHFKTDMAKTDWKLNICRGLLIHSIEIFSDYAAILKEACCLGEEKSHKAEYLDEPDTDTILESYEDQESDSKTTEEVKDQEMQPAEQLDDSDSESSQSSHSSETDKPSSVSGEYDTKPTQTALGQDRYQGIYYTLLEVRMRQVLSDFCVQLDYLLGGSKSLAVDWQKEGFTRVKQIPWSVDLDKELQKPMPPHWIRIAQRMEATRMALRHHKQEVEENELEDI